jgi:hypothetical protein
MKPQRRVEKRDLLLSYPIIYKNNGCYKNNFFFKKMSFTNRQKYFDKIVHRMREKIDRMTKVNP